MVKKIAEDDEYLWYCHLPTCPCLYNEEGEFDGEPAVEDCFYSECPSLELKPKKCPKCGATEIKMLGTPVPFGEEQLYKCKCNVIISVKKGFMEIK